MSMEVPLVKEVQASQVELPSTTGNSNQKKDLDNVPRLMPTVHAVTQSLTTLTFPIDAAESVYNEQTETLAGFYKLKHKIGNGTYGIVRAAEDIRENTQYAVKILNKADMTDNKHIIRVQREIRFLKLLHHPHIIKVKDIFELPSNLFIVMERVTGGELFDYIVAHGKVKEKESRRFFRQIISAVEYCHQNSVIHRDLKPENLLLDSEKNIKLIDLGFANNFKQSQLLETYCGSPNYAAPEMIAGQKYSGPEVDVWSLGIILYALVCGFLPFEDKNIRRLCQKIVRGEYKEPADVSADCKQMISELLEVQPLKRAKLSEVFVHKWVMTGYSEPVDSYVPIRQPINTANLDQDVLAKLKQFGLNNDEIMKSLNEATINPIISTYHLISELMERTRNNQSSPKVPYYIHNSLEDTNNRSLMATSMPNITARHGHKPTSHIEQSTIQSPRKFSVAITRPSPVAVAARRGSEFATESRSENSSPVQLPIATMNESEPRIVSGWFMTYSTTSSKAPHELIKEIKQALDDHQVEHHQDGWVLACSSNEVRLTLEVVRVSRLGICGLIFKRSHGSTTDYRDMCTWIQSSISNQP